jgi:hypothetical protein
MIDRLMRNCHGPAKTCESPMALNFDFPQAGSLPSDLEIQAGQPHELPELWNSPAFTLNGVLEQNVKLYEK